VAQEAVRVGEEVDVRVEREAILALLRDDDDEALARDPAKLAHRSGEIEHMLENMGADHRVEAVVGERQGLDLALDEVERGKAGASALLDDEIGPGELAARMRAGEVVDEIACTATDIEHGRAGDRLADLADAGLAIIGLVLDAGHALVDR